MPRIRICYCRCHRRLKRLLLTEKRYVAVMKSRLIIVLLLLNVAPASRAEFGTSKEVVEAAKKDQQPAYIPELMNAFGDGLRSLLTPTGRQATKIDLRTPKERRAFFLTVLTIVELYLDASHAAMEGSREAAQESAEAAAQKAAWFSTLYGACVAARKAVGYVVWKGAWSAVKKASENAAWHAAEKAAREAVRKAVLYDVDNRLNAIGRIAYRIAEWKMLDYLIEHYATIIPKVYETALASLPESGHDMFTSADEWLKFRSHYFDDLNEREFVFVKPWLDTLDLTFPELVITRLCETHGVPNIFCLLSQRATGVIRVTSPFVRNPTQRP